MYSYLIICESTISHFWISWGWEFIIFDERNIFLGPQGSTGTILVPAAIELVPLICLLPSPPRCCFLHLFCLRLEIFSTTPVVKVKKNFSDMLVERNRMRGDLGPRPRVPDSLLLRVFFLDFFLWGLVLAVPPPPLEWTSFPPLVAAVFITPKGAESPGSRRIGVIGALVYFLPSETV